MSKKNQLRKAQAQAQQEARRLTVGKVVRLLLKSILFAVVVSLTIVLLGFVGIPALDTWWMQLLVLFGVYALAYPFLMSEFRPRTYLRKDRRGRDE